MTATQFAEEPNQEQRIAKLREEIKQLGGDTMSLENMPADLEEEFLRHVLEYETAEPISLFRLLENSGLEMPSPGELTDEIVTMKLTETIERMASLGAYLLHTDHLSDRSLYEYLYSDEADEGEDETISRIVGGGEAALAHEMGHGVDARSAVEKRGGAHEKAPHEKLRAVGVRIVTAGGMRAASPRLPVGWQHRSR